MAPDDLEIHDSGSFTKLPKDIEKILEGQNRPFRSHVPLCGYLYQWFREILLAKKSKPSLYQTNVWSYFPHFEAHRNVRACIYIPKVSCSRKFPIILFFCGGGFVKYNLIWKYDDLCRRLALDLPCVVISIDYPSAPKHKCPTQYNAALESLVYFDQTWSNGRHGTDLSNVFLVGDEAGGNIAHHLATRIASHETKLVNFKIKGLISIQPLFGGEERTESEILLSKSPMLTLKQMDKRWRSFLPDDYDRDCKEVNVSGPNNPKVHLKEFPTTIVIVGGWDPLQDWQKRYFHWLRKCGVDAKLVQYPKAIPQFYLYPKLQESTLLINEVRSFIRFHLLQSSSSLSELN